MYPLTDASEHELRILTETVHEKIQDLNRGLVIAQEFIPEGDVYNDVTRKDVQKIAVLKEWNVRLLTALGMVKDQERVQSN